LTILTGAGADTVNVGMPGEGASAGLEGPAATADVAIRGALVVATGADGDEVNLGNVHVGGLALVSTDGGADAVHVGAEAPAPTTAALVGDGAPATFRAALGLDIALGEGDDSATLRSVAGAQVAVGGGGGGDNVALADVRALVLGLRGGDGDGADVFNLANVHAKLAAIATGGGADHATIADSAFTSLSALMGAGNDVLSLQTVKARHALLAGGEGDADELVEGGVNEFTHKVVSGFEIPPDVNSEPPFRPRSPLARLLGLLRR
jgi:hypothetical protein